jgi:ubiquinol-cytochrome c reductase cytochrome b subunit
MLRSIPDKLGGVICMGASLVILFFLPFLSLQIAVPTKYRLYYIINSSIFFSIFLFLGWIGCQPVEPLYVLLGFLSTVFYFFFFLIFIPVLNILKK